MTRLLSAADADLYPLLLISVRAGLRPGEAAALQWTDIDFDRRELLIERAVSDGKIGTPNMAAYVASKFAMNGFSESLYHELKPLGIHITVVCPGPVKTEFNKAFADRPPKSPRALIMSPEAVSTAVIKAIEAKRFEIVLPRLLAIVCWVKRMTPNVFRAVSHRAFQSRAVALKKNPAA